MIYKVQNNDKTNLPVNLGLSDERSSELELLISKIMKENANSKTVTLSDITEMIAPSLKNTEEGFLAGVLIMGFFVPPVGSAKN